jgi:hypothetical protein
MESDSPNEALASVQFLEDGRAILSVSKHADASSMVHEFGHILRRGLPREDQEKLLSHYQGLEWTDEIEERFAVDFERYVFQSSSPSPQLEQTFAWLKSALRSVYQKISHLMGRQLEPEVKDILDRALETGPLMCNGFYGSLSRSH